MLFSNRDTILFTGDSITDAGRKRPIGEGKWDGVGNGYVRLIDVLLNVCYPENTYHIVNTGISGNTSRDLLARWQTDVLDLKPDYVSVCIGVNDVWRQFDEPDCFYNHVDIQAYRQNLEKMIEITKDKVKGIILMTPYYMESNKEDLMRKKMDEYGAVVKELAQKYNLICVDLQAEFDNYLKYRYSGYLQWDRVHPGPVGSMIIARAFLRAIGFDRKLI
ncbi:MAG TPA: SGNH/GDSL hydrolase family protein [Clostridia bacterium]|jgi:lysophospholipase L1-like esterase